MICTFKNYVPQKIFKPFCRLESVQGTFVNNFNGRYAFHTYAAISCVIINTGHDNL